MNRRRLATLGLAGTLALAPALNGCTTYQPKFDQRSGRYVGEEKVEDRGKTVQGIGSVLGGAPGLLLQMMGSKASKDQQRQINEQRMMGMQRQIDQRGTYQAHPALGSLGSMSLQQQDAQVDHISGMIVTHLTTMGDYTPEMKNVVTGTIRDVFNEQLENVRKSSASSPRELFSRKFNEHYLTTFVCNNISDSDGNGTIEASNIQGDLDGNFTWTEPITLGYTHFNQPGREVNLQLRLPSGRTHERQFTAKANGQLEYFALPDNLREPGHYTFIAYVGKAYEGHTEFSISSEREEPTRVRVFNDE